MSSPLVLTTLLLATVSADPPVAAETNPQPTFNEAADAPATVAPAAVVPESVTPPAATQPVAQTATQPAETAPIKVHPSQYGVHVEGGQAGKLDYKRRTWRDVVRSTPELLRLNRRRKMIIPGTILTGIGGAALVISAFSAIDHGMPRSATGNLFAWGLPGAMLAAGIPLTVLGARAARKLHHERVRLMAAPMASRTSAGAVVIGHF